MRRTIAAVAVLLAQIGTFESTKDYILLALIGFVGSLLAASWADQRGKIKSVDDRLSDKIKQDSTGYERLTRCEERLTELSRRLDKIEKWQDDHEP